jgi:hypothetical protein
MDIQGRIMRPAVGLELGESSTLNFDLCTVPIRHIHPGRIRDMVRSGRFVGGGAAGLADWLVPLVDSRLWTLERDKPLTDSPPHHRLRERRLSRTRACLPLYPLTTMADPPSPPIVLILVGIPGSGKVRPPPRSRRTRAV